MNDNFDRTEQITILHDDTTTIRTNPKKSKKNSVGLTIWNVVVAIITVLINILVIYILFYTTQFSVVKQDMFKKINLIALCALLLVDFIAMLAIKLRKPATYIISGIVLALGIGAGGYGTFAVTRVEEDLTQITNTTQTQDVSTALVIYSKSSGEPIWEVADLDGREVGIVAGTAIADLTKQRLQNEGVTPVYKEYYSYADAFKALISDEVDCAALPKNYELALGTEELLEPYLVDTSALLTFTESVTSTNQDGADKDLTLHPFTVLLSGENEGLADTIILISVNPLSMKVTMSSIARDSFVPITCYGGVSSKINSAHAVSEDCLISTVEALTGVGIDYYVEFNFASVIEVVDAVGGVDVYNPVEFMGQCWDVATDSLVVLPIPAGYVHLTGQQALGFARERYAFENGDFARQQHQQEIIENVVKRVMDTRDPNTYLKILDAAGNNIRTNLTTNQMVNFVSYAMKKANRYYDTGTNPAGVFNIVSSRVTGYSAQIWDDGLAMYLYIYRVFNGSLYDTATAVDRNTNMSGWFPSVPTSVSWSAGNEDYIAPVISQEWYSEAMIGTIGGPPEETVTEPEQQEELEEPEVPEEPEYIEPVEPIYEEPTEPVYEEPEVIEGEGE